MPSPSPTCCARPAPRSARSARRGRPRRERGARLVDVRETQRVGGGPHPRRDPHPQELPRAADRGGRPRSRPPVVLYCAGGVRSLLAAQTLAAMGYTDVALDDRRLPGAGRPRAADGRTPAVLTAEQKQRYSRHLLMPEVGAEGQAKLLDSKVLLIGAGGLGCAGPALPRGGRRRARSASSTSTSSTCPTSSARSSTPTTASARRRSSRRGETIQALNPDVKVVAYEEMLTEDNVERIIAGYDVILDGTDTFETRYTLNDAAVRAGIPVVHAVGLPLRGPADGLQAVRRARATAACTPRRRRPSSRPAAPWPACSASCPGIMGLLQATEAIKLLLEHRRPARRPAADLTTPWTPPSASSSCGATRTARPAADAAVEARAAGRPLPWRARRCAVRSSRRRPGSARADDRGAHPAGAAGDGRRQEAGRGRRRDRRRGARRSWSSQYPALREQLLTADGELNRFVNVYVNGQDVRYLQELARRSPRDTVILLPAMAGGAVTEAQWPDRCPAIRPRRSSGRYASTSSTRSGTRRWSRSRGCRPSPSVRLLRQARVPEPHGVGQGPRRAGPDRGPRGVRAAGTRLDHPRADLRQHRHRAGDDRRAARAIRSRS